MSSLQPQPHRPASRLAAALRRNLTGWRRTVYIMYFVQFVSTLGFAIIYPFLPLYIETLGTRSNLNLGLEFWAGMVFSAQAFTMMLASPVWGALADRYGRKLMVQRATFGGALVMGLMAFAGSAEELVLLRAVQGLVTGTVAAANALVVAVAPREQTGSAVGGLEMSRWLGVSLGPLIGGLLADAFGFAAPFLATAAMLAAAGLAVQFGVKEEFQPLHTEDRGSKRRVGYLEEYRHVLAATGMKLTYGLRFLAHLGSSTLTPVIPLFMVALLPQETEHVATTTGLVTSVASLTGTISAVYLGRLGDRIGHRRVLFGAALAAGLTYLPQALVTEAWQLLLLQAVTGATVGGMTPALSALLAGYSSPGEEGAVYGLDNSIVAAGRTIAPLVGGAAAAWSTLRLPFLLTGGIFIAVAALAFARLPDGREQASRQRKPAPAPAGR